MSVRRFLCFFLLLLMLYPAGAFGEDISGSGTEYDPEKFISGIRIFDYSDAVTPGQIRFVSQKFATAAQYGWGKYAKNRGTSHGPAHNCTAAVQSMAFSYIGIDASPEAVVAQVTSFITNYGFEEADMAYRTGYSASAESLDRFLDRFLQDDGNGIISPVIVHYQNGKKKSSLHQHCILVIGRDEEGRYLAVDPAQTWDDCIRTFTVRKKKNGRYYLSGNVARGNESVYLDAVEQYYLRDPGLEYFGSSFAGNG